MLSFWNLRTRRSAARSRLLYFPTAFSMTRFPPGFSSIVYIILICSSGWSVAEHYKPKLLSNNLDHTKTNLYQFCLPVDELVLLDQKNAYLEITSPDPLSYVAIDWEGGTSGLDLVWYPDGQSEVLRVPLILGEEYQNGWKPNLKTPSCIDGFIVSSDEISKLTLAMSNLPASAYTSQKDGTDKTNIDVYHVTNKHSHSLSFL